MKLTLLLSLVLYATHAQSQTLFNNIYPKSNWDFSTAVIETNENSYLIASSSRSQFNSDYDVLLMNIDTTGNIIWEKYIGQTNKLEFASSISKTNDGGYIIGGSYRAPGADFYSYDTYILKIDEDGDEMWSTRVNPTALFEDGFSAFENTSGEYIIIGGSNHTHLYNLSNTGDLNWSTLFQNFSCQHIEQLSIGGYAMIGTTTGLENTEILMIKTSADGDSIWSKQIEEEGNIFAYTFTITPDDGFLIAAAYDDYSITDSDFMTNLIRTDSNGDTLWTRKYPTGTPHHIKNTSDGGFIYSSIQSQNLPFNNGYGIAIAKINGDGEMEWQRSFSNRNLYGPGNNVLELNDGGYLLTGHTEDGDMSNVFLIRLGVQGDFVIGINLLKIDESVVEMYPNPSSDKVTIKLADVSHAGQFEIRIFDELGKQVKSYRHFSINSSALDISDLKAGLYFVHLFDPQNGTLNATKKLLVIK